MKTAITDYTFPDLDVEKGILEPLGSEIVSGHCKTPQAVIELARDCDYVIVQFAPLDADVINALEKTKVIVRYGIGYDNVDVVAARARNIDVCNIPDYCVEEVADHTMSFILAVTRGVIPNCLRLRGGNWGLGVRIEQMKCLRDMTVGVVGLGRIGRAVVERLKPFHCRIVVHDPLVDAREISAVGASSVSFAELLSVSNLVTLHCPANEHTRGLINGTTIAQMSAGSILVNVGRGGLVDTEALVAALQSGHLSAAALDVFDPEPLPAGHPLLTMDNVIVTAHIASASVPAARTLRETAANMIATAIRGEPLPNIVNPR